METVYRNMRMSDIAGAQVALIDDMQDEISSIQTALDELNISSQYFNADVVTANYPAVPIETIEIVFLDLHYNTNFGALFDATLCVQWLSHIIPKGKKYILVVWTMDPERAQDLLSTLQQEDVTLPFLIETKQKSDYQNGKNIEEARRLISELNDRLESEMAYHSEEYIGQIIALDDSDVLINCLIYQEPVTFEVRRFDSELFRKMQIEKGKFIHIKVVTKPGARTFEFSEECTDKSELFKKPDDFEDIGDIEFLKE